MSESQQSRASVIRVKGVSFNYLQFLWGEIGKVRQAQAQGDYATALALASTAIGYLPDSMKDEFRNRAHHIQFMMDQIRAGNFPQAQAIPCFFIRGIYRNRVLQVYAYQALNKFVDDMTSQLNQLGYMENLKMVAEGTADVTDDWIEIDKRRKKRRKGGRKKEKVPIGQMD